MFALSTVYRYWFFSSSLAIQEKSSIFLVLRKFFEKFRKSLEKFYSTFCFCMKKKPLGIILSVSVVNILKFPRGNVLSLFQGLQFSVKYTGNVLIVRFSALYHSKKLYKTDENFLEPSLEVKQNTLQFVQQFSWLFLFFFI